MVSLTNLKQIYSFNLKCLVTISKKRHLLRKVLAKQKLNSIKSSWTDGHIRWIKSTDISETDSAFIIRILISVPTGVAFSSESFYWILSLLNVQDYKLNVHNHMQISPQHANVSHFNSVSSFILYLSEIYFNTLLWTFKSPKWSGCSPGFQTKMLWTFLIFPWMVYVPPIPFFLF
jgi:hypothetical protein